MRLTVSVCSFLTIYELITEPTWASTQFVNFGPCKQYSSINYERVHKNAKDVMTRSNNTIDVSFTIATRYFDKLDFFNFVSKQQSTFSHSEFWFQMHLSTKANTAISRGLNKCTHLKRKFKLDFTVSNQFDSL